MNPDQLVLCPFSATLVKARDRVGVRLDPEMENVVHKNKDRTVQPSQALRALKLDKVELLSTGAEVLSDS